MGIVPPCKEGDRLEHDASNVPGPCLWLPLTE